MDDAGFREFVARHRSALLRTAHLLTGDHRQAEALVQTALLETHRHWRRVADRGDPSAHVQRALVTAATGRRRLGPGTEQVVETLPDLSHDDPETRSAAVLRALRQLPPRMRAVVVLRHHDDHTEAEAADLLGCPVGTVRAEASRALSRLRVALADERPGADGEGAVVDEQHLRTLLHGAARPPAAVMDDDEATDAVVRTHRARRRQRLGLAAVAVAVAVGLVAVLTPSPPGGRGPVERQVAASPSGTAPDWPTRGSLAGDAAALDAARRLPWSDPSTAPPVADREVLFLGDAAGTRWALVVGRAGDHATGQWSTGPAGADPSSLRPDGAVRSVAGVASIGHASAGGHALVLTDPGTLVEVSPGVVVGADGTVRRDFAPVETTDGVAVFPVAATGPYGTGHVHRVLRGDELVAVASLPAPAGTGEVAGPRLLTPRDPSGGPPAPRAVDHAVGAVLGATGVREEDVRLDLLWSGPVPRDGGVPADAVVVALTVPGGAVVVSVAWADVGPSGSGSAGSCGAQAHPAGTPLDAVAVAAECAFPTRGFARESVLVAYAAPAAGRVEVLDAGGRAVLGTAGGSGAITVAPAPGRSVLRVGRPGAPAAEQAVVPLGGALVDLAGRSADG